MKLYGIANCSTVKKARAFLDSRGVAYTFVDFKKTPPAAEEIAGWLKILGRDTLINRKGTTWRRLDDAAKAAADADGAVCALLAEYPTLIKRPLVQWQDGTLTAGFDETLFAEKTALL